jgi:hypothetical protein
MRAYNLLLRVYPASFRNEYGEEMRAVFARRRREVTGPLTTISLWLQTIGEAAGNAALVHVDLLRQDLHYTARMLRRTPGFAVTAVLIVALGIGATTAAFTVTDFVLLRPLPFPQPERLVKLWETHPNYGRTELSAGNYRDWKRGSTVFESIGLYHLHAGNLVGSSEPLRVEGASVSADLFPTLGVQPLIGRRFVESDDREGAAGTTMLSYRLWQTRFGGDPAIVGQQVMLDTESYTVIGVMPRAFRFPGQEASLWIPLRHSEREWAERKFLIRQPCHVGGHRPPGPVTPGPDVGVASAAVMPGHGRVMGRCVDDGDVAKDADSHIDGAEMAERARPRGELEELVLVQHRPVGGATEKIVGEDLAEAVHVAHPHGFEVRIVQLAKRLDVVGHVYSRRHPLASCSPSAPGTQIMRTFAGPFALLLCWTLSPGLTNPSMPGPSRWVWPLTTC